MKGAFSNETLTLNKASGDIEINAPFVEQTELSQYALKNMQITNVTYNNNILTFYRPIGNIELNVRFPSGEPLISNIGARVTHTSGDIILTITWTANMDEIGDLTAEMDADFSATYSRAGMSNTFRDSFSAYRISNTTLRNGSLSKTFEILSGMITIPISSATLVSFNGTFTFSDDTIISFSV